MLQSPINLALETDQRQTRQSSDLSSNQTFDLTIPRLLQQMSYGLRLFCLQETTQNSSNGARLSKPDALFLKKQTLEKLMQAFYSVQLKNATPSHRWHRVMMALWNDLLWIHCKKKRIRFCVWNTPAATMQTQNKQREITDTNASRHLKRTLIIIPDNTWNVWGIYLRATC